MSITFHFTNRNVGEDGLRVYRSTEPFTEHTLPSVYANLNPGLKTYVDIAVSRGEKYYYIFETYRGGDRAFSLVVFAEALPTETGPGAQVLIGGDNWSGFYGEIPASEFITGDALAAHFGLTVGTSQHNDTEWLKFACDGETLFIPKKPLRRSISWAQLQASNLVFGDRVIEIAGDLYQIRLIKGSATDPYVGGTSGFDLVSTHGSEWNRLFYPLVPTPTQKPASGVSGEGIRYGEWASYTETELVLLRESGSGSANWCQESQGSNRVYRGYSCVSYLSLEVATSTNEHVGWRPVLQLLRRRDQFLGEVPVSEFITGDALATAIGLTVGTAQYSDEPWLKFITRDNKTLYVAKKPYRHSISWSHINAQGAVLGDRVVYLNGHKYKVRLLKGAITNPTVSGNGYDLDRTWDSEWNRLMYPLIRDISDKTQIPTYPVSGEGIEFGSWADYTETDLVMAAVGGDGHYSWCQESQGSNRVVRGSDGVSYLRIVSSSTAIATFGWRPVLELIED